MNAVLSRRISQKDPASHSLDTQLAALTPHCAAKGWNIVGDFPDEGISGTVPPLKRKGFAAAVECAKANAPCVIVCWKLDRFSRDTESALAFIRALPEDVFIQFLDFPADTASPMGRVMLTVGLAFAEYYVNDIKAKTAEALDTVRAKGIVGGKPPLGFIRESRRDMGNGRSEGGRIVPDLSINATRVREGILAAMAAGTAPGAVARIFAARSLRNEPDGTTFWKTKRIKELFAAYGRLRELGVITM